MPPSYSTVNSALSSGVNGTLLMRWQTSSQDDVSHQVPIYMNCWKESYTCVCDRYRYDFVVACSQLDGVPLVLFVLADGKLHKMCACSRTCWFQHQTIMAFECPTWLVITQYNQLASGKLTM